MNSIIEKLTDKRILIFGYGREGKSTEEYIKAHVKYRSLDIFEGKREDICEADYDYIIKSPGIVMLDDNPKYTSQTELFLDEFAGQTVGITGTKGKSTTSSMLAYVLNQCFKAGVSTDLDAGENSCETSSIAVGEVSCVGDSKGSNAEKNATNRTTANKNAVNENVTKETTKKTIAKKAILLGNIGKPCFDMIDEIDEDTIIVFELSCHQLLHINKAPHIAVFLNLFEEHLDYYGTMDRYFGAKANIISHQVAGDFCFVGENVPHIDHKSDMTVIDGPKREYELSILGEHNKTNAEFVYEIAEMICGGDKSPAMITDELCEINVSENQNIVDITSSKIDSNEIAKTTKTSQNKAELERKILSAIHTFTGLPHRLEYFAEIDGVKYYDDSISTIPEACINAVKSVPNAATVIVGGMDRGIDYDILVDYIRETPDVLFILCYATGQRIFSELGFDYEDNSIYPKDYENFMSTQYVGDAAEYYKYKENMPKNVMLTTNLDYAVKLAKEKTQTGKACILSPAAPSYGYFKNFEERGQYFKDIVRK